MAADKDREDDYTMYILINTDLGMQKGKIASQVGHVVGMLVERIMRGTYEGTGATKEQQLAYLRWKKTGHKKIVLKATQKELEAIKDNPDAEYVVDAGKTQIPENSLTVVGFLPSCKNKAMFTCYKLL